ncbi:MAG: SHOCT domain-containing protein, partial [Kineosporiaceae bacterium]
MFNNNGSFLLALFEFFVFFAWFMCLFWIFGDLFRSRDLSGWAKTLW